MALTELTVRQCRAKEKTYMLSDGRGLALEVRPNGAKYWVIRYWVGGKERRTSAGPYPRVGLKEAREKNFELRKSLDTGKPIGLDAETFATVAAEWLDKRMIPARSPQYVRNLRSRLDRLVYPFIGKMKIADITSGVVLQVCRRVESKGTLETASLVRQLIGQVFRYAIATDRAETDPTVALKGALQVRRPQHYPTITEPIKIGILLRQIDAYPYAVTRCALMLSILVFLRPGELRRGEWAEIDWERAEWKIPPERMKIKRPHVVPLSRQAIGVLKELRELTGKGPLMFPSERHDGRPMSDNTVRSALRAMGYSNETIVPHGFRAMASTVLNDNRLFEPDVIERQLAHAEKNAVRDAYNHAEYMPRRREMMQWWADWLDWLR
jgi:integrase